MVITVVIPTNRYACIKEIIKKSIAPYKGILFRFEIHDSSSDGRIENLILPYQKKRKDIFTYHRYSSTISAGNKTMDALENVSTEYFWLMGDGNLVDFNKMEILLREKISDYTVVDVESLNRIGHMGQDKGYMREQINECSDIRLYAKKYFSHLTYWGAQVIQTRYFQKCYKNGILKKYRMHQIPWWIACSLFDLLACSAQCQEKVKLGVVYTEHVKSNTVKKDHWWSKDEHYYIYTFTKFNQGIEFLPSFYSDEVKREIIKVFRKDALVSNYYLINLRAIDNLKLEMLRKYKQEINILPGFYRKMYLYHLMPQILAKFLDYLKTGVKPLYFSMKRRMLK